MIKIIIAEDENIVRLGLSTMISWKDHNFELCGLFRNGQEALEYLLKNSVDIVITDIKMPVMSGDELVRQIRAHDLHPYIIILSNYDDFALVKSCFQYGITDYLLKQDLEQDSLLRILKNLSEKIAQTDEAPYQPSLTTYEFFNELVKTDFQEDISRLQIKYQKIFTRLKQQAFCVCIADIVHEETHKRYAGINPVYTVLEKVFKEILNKYTKNYLFLYSNKELLLILCPPVDASDIFFSDLLPTAAEKVNDRLKSFFNVTVRIGASRLVYSPHGLKNAFHQAQHSHLALFYQQGNLCIYSRKYLLYDKEIPMPVNYSPIRKAIHLGNITCIKQLCQETFHELRKTQEVVPEKVINYVEFIFMDLNQFLSETYYTSLFQFDENWNHFDKIYHFNIRALETYLFQVLDRINCYLKSREDCSAIITDAKQYINDHYHENITLRTVADHLHINASYFSSTFKTKTGVSFTQYLTEIRIQKALLLVKTTRKSTEEIAELVGYSTPNYFIKVFKKVTGSTVSEYRNKEANIKNRPES